MATRYKEEVQLFHGCGGEETGAVHLLQTRQIGWLHLRHLPFNLVTKCPVLVSTKTWLVFLATTTDDLESCWSLLFWGLGTLQPPCFVYRLWPVYLYSENFPTHRRSDSSVNSAALSFSPEPNWLFLVSLSLSLPTPPCLQPLKRYVREWRHKPMTFLHNTGKDFFF